MSKTIVAWRWKITSMILAYLLVAVLVSVEEWNWTWFLLEGDEYDAQPIPLAMARTVVTFVAIVVVGTAGIVAIGGALLLLANIAHRIAVEVRRTVSVLRARFQ